MKLKELANDKDIKVGLITVNRKIVKDPDHELQKNDKVIVGGVLFVITGRGKK